MFKSKVGKWLVTGLLVAAVLTVGLVGTGLGVVSVAAQEDDDGDDTGFLGRFGPGVRGFMGRFGVRDGSHLADQLGITVEELEAAREAAHEAAVAQAVEDGDLTQEEADAMLARQALRDVIDPRALMAEVLGITEEQLLEQPVHEWIEEQGLDVETFHDEMQAAYEDAVAQAVADGVITQDQADALLSGDTGFGIRRGGVGGGLGGGMRGGRGRGFRNPGDCPGMGPGRWNSETDPDA